MQYIAGTFFILNGLNAQMFVCRPTNTHFFTHIVCNYVSVKAEMDTIDRCKETSIKQNELGKNQEINKVKMITAITEILGLVK